MASKQQRKQELTARQAVLKLTGVSHYVVKFECDECISVIPRKFLLDPPEPLVGDECRVEWSGEEYAAKILAMGDDQQARKAEIELLKALNQGSDTDNQPPAKKPRLLKSLKKKTASVKPKKKTREKSSQPKAKKGKVPDFSLDLGSPAKTDNNQQSKQQADQPQSKHSERTKPSQSSHSDQVQSDNPERSEPSQSCYGDQVQSDHPERSKPSQSSHDDQVQSDHPERSEPSQSSHDDQVQSDHPERSEPSRVSHGDQQDGYQQGTPSRHLQNQHDDQPSISFDSSISSLDDSDEIYTRDLFPKKV